MSEIEDQEHPECKVCFNFFTSYKHPIKLGCNHTFCVKCIDHLQSEICPLCRAPFQSSDDDLQPNFEMIEILKKTEKYNCQTLIQEQKKECDDLFKIQSKADDEYVSVYNDEDIIANRLFLDLITNIITRYYAPVRYEWRADFVNVYLPPTLIHVDFNARQESLIQLPELPFALPVRQIKFALPVRQIKFEDKKYEKKQNKDRLSYIKFINRQLNRKQHISQQGKSFR